jgi:nucleotide-binding universal stress UspA family protein
MYKHILIPLDGTPLGNKAVDAALVLARDNGAKVTFFTAVPEDQVPGEGLVIAHKVISIAEHARRSERKANEILAPAAEKARAAQLEAGTHFTQSNRPWQAIVEAARQLGCDAIVMASHGRKGISRILLGSETQQVLTHSSIPVLVLR